MRSTSVRLAIPAAAFAAAALALTGCSSQNAADPGSSALTTPSASSAPAGPSASSGASGASTAPGAPTDGTGGGAGTASANAGGGSGGGSGGEQAAAAPGGACTSAQLKATIADPSVGAGQFYAKIVFTNTADTSCTLTGYPGLSYVVADGRQSGNPAARTGGTVHTVRVAAHGTADATMHDSNGISGYDPGQCDLTHAKGLRVYPPNEKAALYIPDARSHCAGTGIHPLTITPVG